MVEFKVYTSRYPIRTVRETKQRRKRRSVISMGKLEERTNLSESITAKLNELKKQGKGKGWKVALISTTTGQGDWIFTVLFEKP